MTIPIAIVLDSPWWLAREGEFGKANEAHKRLVSDNSPEHVNNAVGFMIHTTKMEQDVQSGATYLDCVRGIDFRRTEIVLLD